MIFTDVLYAILIMIPMVFNGILVVYFIDGVLKYHFKNRKRAYLLISIPSVIAGLAWSLIYLSDQTDSSPNDLSNILILSAYLIMFILLVCELEGKIWKRIVLTLMSFEILTSFNDIFTTLRDSFFGEDLLIGNFDMKLVMLILFNLLMILFELLFFRIIDRVRSKNDNEPLPMPVIVIFMLFLTVFTSFLPYDTEIEEPVSTVFDSSNRPVFIILMLVGLFLVFIFFYVRVTRKDRDGFKELNSVNEKLVDSQTKYFEASVKADTEIRAMRHDMRNNVQVLMLLLESGEYDKMREFLEQMGEGLAKTDISAHTGNTIADAIIAEKTEEASRKGLTLKSTGVISGVEISPADMCKILSNLLDNAIEAVSSEKLKDLDDDLKLIDLQFKRTDNFFMIDIVNPCASAPEIKNGSVVTSKGDKKNHGFGIRNIRSAVESYNGELEMECEPKPYGFEFRTDIMIPVSE